MLVSLLCRLVVEGGGTLENPRQAVAELRVGRWVAKRRGVKPLPDQATNASVEQGRSWVHDGTYLELAVRQKLPLASRDEALCKAAQSCRVKLLL